VTSRTDRPFVVDFGSLGRPAEPDGRLDAPAFHRNHAPIQAVLAQYLRGKRGDVLELGSGTGQHAVEFARTFPELVWWPSDLNDNHLRSIEAWRAYVQLANLRPPLRIDIAAPDWGVTQSDAKFLAIVCINVLHIAPWSVSEGLFANAARHLRHDGRLFIYGPFMRDGRHTADSNAAFDASLRQQNAAWGVRDTADLRDLAAHAGLTLAAIHEMPANNFTLMFARQFDHRA
jgi:SAM-dependent methyltransferase